MENTGMLSRNKKGQGMTEYIIVVALIAVGAIVMIGLFGDSVRTNFRVAIDYLSGTADTKRTDNSGAAQTAEKKDWKTYNDGK